MDYAAIEELCKMSQEDLDSEFGRITTLINDQGVDIENITKLCCISVVIYERLKIEQRNKDFEELNKCIDELIDILEENKK